MPYTGPYPTSNMENCAAYRAAEIKRQGGGFKKAKTADSYDMGMPMTQDTAMDAYPSLKANKDGTSAHGGTVYTKAGPELICPTKKRPFGHEAPMTGVPEGRALPNRGEGPTANTGPTVGKNVSR